MIFVKDPNAILDYYVDWTAWLAGDTIVASSWCVMPASLAVDSDAIMVGLKKTVVWLSGGVAGATYQAVNHIETASGREDDRTIMIKVEDK